MSHSPQSTTSAKSEALRLLFVTAIALWAVSPYFAPRLIGAGDALWYHHLMADAVTQFRAGVFPVFVGQSEYSFNGAIYPLRAAPYYQYLGGLIDLATGRNWSFFALQHATAMLSIVGGAWTAYFSLAWMLTQRRWIASFLALIYVFSPGVIGLLYAQDLYMSVMTTPWVILSVAATIKTFDPRSRWATPLLGLAVGALWWAHSPIALWVTMGMTFLQCIRWLPEWRSATSWKQIARGGGVFAVIACYPILSMFLVRTGDETIVPYSMDRASLLAEIRAVFPYCLEPIRRAPTALAQLQLGYPIILLVFALLTFSLRSAPRRIWVLGLSLLVTFLIVLIFPVPGLTSWLWHHFPETLVGMTLYWPMQRLCIIIAAIATLGGAITLQNLHERWTKPITVALAIALGWSVWEVEAFRAKALSQADTRESSALLALPENIAIQRHTYGLFPRRPAYFSHGVVDPREELRLLSATTGTILGSNYPEPLPEGAGEHLTGVVDTNPGIINLFPRIRLEPGRRYWLNLRFQHPSETQGVLQIKGATTTREYALPSSGESKSFGTTPGSATALVLWTSARVAEELSLRFIPNTPDPKAELFGNFGTFTLTEIIPDQQMISVESLIPLKATVRSTQSALLETPRMFIPGYVATVNDQPVATRRSAEGLVAFAVPAGTSQVSLRYEGPSLLRTTFIISCIGWIAAIICIPWLAIRQAFGTRPTAASQLP